MIFFPKPGNRTHPRKSPQSYEASLGRGRVEALEDRPTVFDVGPTVVLDPTPTDRGQGHGQNQRWGQNHVWFTPTLSLNREAYTFSRLGVDLNGRAEKGKQKRVDWRQHCEK